MDSTRASLVADVLNEGGCVSAKVGSEGVMPLWLGGSAEIKCPRGGSCTVVEGNPCRAGIEFTELDLKRIENFLGMAAGYEACGGSF